MEKTKRSTSKTGWMWRFMIAFLFLIPVSVLIVLAFFGARFSSSGQETRLTGGAAAQWAEGLLKEPLPVSASDLTYYEKKKGFDPFEATIQFKAKPEEYLEFIGRAAPLCFDTPLQPEGDQATLPGDRCDQVRMNITVDKSNETEWQVTIFIDSFR